MFGRKKKKEQREEHKREIRKGLIFWLPGGASRLDVYLDYCVIRFLAKTKMKEKERVIPFSSIKDVIYTPATNSRHASLQLITKEMPDVKRSFWYAYENNLVVVHPSTEELAKNIREYILNPNGSNVVPPEYLSELKKAAKQVRREEQEAKEAAEKEKKEQARAARAAAKAAAEQEKAEAAEAAQPEAESEEAPAETKE